MDSVDKRLSEIEARLDAATPGPWVAESAKESWCGVYGPGGSVLLYGISSYEDDVAGEYAQDLANVTFAANAMEDIPWLILQVRAQMGIVGAIRRWRLALEHLSDGYYSVADATLEMKEAEATIDTALAALAPEP